MLRTLPAALALLAFAAPASAQFAVNRDAPIVIDADRADARPGYTELVGQVDVRQGDVRILADRMKIFTAGGTTAAAATDGITRIEALGNFYYITPDQEVKGSQGLYEAKTETFTVTGDVVLLQGENVVTGDTLVYDLNTDEARVVGTCEGRRCGSTGRVRILLRQQDETATPVDTPS